MPVEHKLAFFPALRKLSLNTIKKLQMDFPVFSVFSKKKKIIIRKCPIMPLQICFIKWNKLYYKKGRFQKLVLISIYN